MQFIPITTRGSVVPLVLMASVLFGFAALSTVMLTNFSSREAAMTIDPTELTTVPGQTFTISVLVSSALPVNAFTGMVTFDHSVVAVDSISYNTSIADLWTEEPWFSQGDGTINFTGGTTHPGGFTGTGALVTVTFKAVAPGDAKLQLHDARILEHDGFGTDALLATQIDTIFTVATDTIRTSANVDTITSVTVMPTFAPTDLNRDGHVTLGDISIFLIYLATADARGDVTADGHVNATDFSVMLDARNH